MNKDLIDLFLEFLADEGEGPDPVVITGETHAEVWDEFIGRLNRPMLSDAAKSRRLREYLTPIERASFDGLEFIPTKDSAEIVELPYWEREAIEARPIEEVLYVPLGLSPPTPAPAAAPASRKPDDP